MRLELSTEYGFNTDMTYLRVVQRVDSALNDLTGAIKWYAGAGT